MGSKCIKSAEKDAEIVIEKIEKINWAHYASDLEKAIGEVQKIIADIKAKNAPALVKDAAEGVAEVALSP